VIIIAAKTTAVVNLKAIYDNAKKIKELTGKNVLLCGVVKADAYGHGGAAVANALYPLCDFFAVALTDEGIALRQAGIDKRILLLMPITQREERAVRYNLTLTVSKISHIKIIETICRRINKRASVHIKYNSGMNRLGCEFNELYSLVDLILKSKYLELEGIYSHFYMPENEIFREEQYLSFLKAQNYVKSRQCNIIAHISASGGILAGKKYNFDMVRAGIMLYGYKPYESDKIQLKHALKISAEVIQNKTVTAGHNLLYGNYKLNESKNISLIRLGYADGFLRKGTEKNLNNLCMDISAQSSVCGKTITITDFQEIAKEYKTISYEVLCNVTKRSEMVYLR